jgi:drug/metabolite transporter (DMT)-like permease
MNVVKAISLKVLSALLFAVMSALVRFLGETYPVGQIVFFRSAFAILPVLVIYAWRNELAAAVRAVRPLGQIGRGLISIWRERRLGLQRVRAAEGPPTGA